MVRGDYLEAYREMMAGAEDEGTATFYLAEAIRSALWMRDRDRARATLERLDGHPDASMRLNAATRLAARAGIAALEGRTEEARAGFVEAWRRFHELDVDFVFAWTVLDAVALLGTPTPEIRTAALEAR